MLTSLEQYRQRVLEHLTRELLPWWRDHDCWDAKDAFYGWLDDEGRPTKGEDHPWHSVLFSRLLWTFSAAARFTADAQWRPLADRALRVFHSHFQDREHGGALWMVAPDGEVLDGRKQSYGQAFWIYALCEYHLATGDAAALEDALGIFRLLLAHAHDRTFGGPIEARSRDWSDIEDMSLARGEPGLPKSMNTHLHVLEAYTNLVRCVRDAQTQAALREVLLAFLEHVTDSRGFFHQFLHLDYTPQPGLASYGHDIEGSWLLWEAAEVLGDPELLQRARSLCIALCDHASGYGIDPDGGIIDEGDYDGNPIHTRKVWWSQAEAAVGQFNAYQLTGERRFLEGSWKTWQFIEDHILDTAHGEWISEVNREGQRVKLLEKVGPWKCPYHNARACMEIARRVDEIDRGGTHQ